MRARERGSATVLAVGVIAVVILVLGGALAVARAVRASAHAAAAADMAALAGARVLQDSAEPLACAEASRIAARNGGVLLSCATHGRALSVQVSVESGVPGAPAATARARAGPAEVTSSANVRATGSAIRKLRTAS